MISFVVCSVSPDKLRVLQENVAHTVGVAYEFIVIDNRAGNYSLCQAYNMGAAQARYDNLCFAHEDIVFRADQGWGAVIEAQLAKPDTGVIGFAGSTGKTRTLSTWVLTSFYRRANFCEVVDGVAKMEVANPLGEDFSQVIVLDGLCLFMRRAVWVEHQFDSQTLDGFHLYDLDISVAVARGYKNYVCHRVLVEHFSRGSFGGQWFSYSLKFHEKWREVLPMYVDPNAPWQRNERQVLRRMVYFLMKRSLLSKEELGQMVARCIRYFPFRPGSYYLWWKYLWYKGRSVS